MAKNLKWTKPKLSLKWTEPKLREVTAWRSYCQSGQGDSRQCSRGRGGGTYKCSKGSGAGSYCNTGNVVGGIYTG